MAQNVRKRYLDRVPRQILDQLDNEQREALVEALQPAPGKQPVDIRLNIPIGTERFYLAILSGRERRGVERRKQDRKSHPLPTFGNLMFVLGAMALVYVLAVFGALIYSSVLVF